jgi:hypothetical protein
MLIGYAAYAVVADEQDLLGERFTRFSYHVEELGGHVGNFIRRLNHQGVVWKTERTMSLLSGIASGIERFEDELLVRSRYATEPYKGGQDLRLVLKSHVADLRKLAA